VTYIYDRGNGFSVFTFFENYSTSITIMELLSTNSRPSGQVAACACSYTDFSSDCSAFLATLFTLSNFQCSVKAFLHGISDYFPSTLSTSMPYDRVIVDCHCGLRNALFERSQHQHQRFPTYASISNPHLPRWILKNISSPLIVRRFRSYEPEMGFV
jgi:hypothetical protein